MRCWLAQTLELDACDGRLDAAHIGFTEHFLLKAPTGPRLSKASANDPMLLRPICRKHHHRLDFGSLSLTREQLPSSVERFAETYHLGWKLERDYAHGE